MIAQGGGLLRRGREREAVFVEEGDAGWGEGTEAHAPAFEEDYLDRALVFGWVVDGAGGWGAVPESGVQ